MRKNNNNSVTHASFMEYVFLYQKYSLKLNNLVQFESRLCCPIWSYSIAATLTLLLKKRVSDLHNGFKLIHKTYYK